MFKILLATLAFSLISSAAMASTAGCDGVINGKKFSFVARGSMKNKNDGIGFVKVDGREVARFDGDAAHISYLRRTFYIANDRGDVVEGKLNNIINGRATLRRLSIPGHGIKVTNAPVECWIRN